MLRRAPGPLPAAVAERACGGALTPVPPATEAARRASSPPGRLRRHWQSVLRKRDDHRHTRAPSVRNVTRPSFPSSPRGRRGPARRAAHRVMQLCGLDDQVWRRGRGDGSAGGHGGLDAGVGAAVPGEPVRSLKKHSDRGMLSRASTRRQRAPQGPLRGERTVADLRGPRSVAAILSGKGTALHRVRLWAWLADWRCLTEAWHGSSRRRMPRDGFGPRDSPKPSPF
jgi:hypothetical protein